MIICETLFVILRICYSNTENNSRIIRQKRINNYEKDNKANCLVFWKRKS